MNHIQHYKVRPEGRSDVALGYMCVKNRTSEKQVG